MGPRAGLDTEDKEKLLCPCRGSDPDRPVVQPVVRHYTAWANSALQVLAVDFVYTKLSCETEIILRIIYKIFSVKRMVTAIFFKKNK
jgi:hypothetical protein